VLRRQPAWLRKLAAASCLIRKICALYALPCACLPSLQLGSTAIAVRTDEGVVMAVEKRVTSPLLVRTQRHCGLPTPRCRLLQEHCLLA
jgi:hypothetical protein